MLLPLVLLVLGSYRVPSPFDVHPEWGPEPPVAPYGRNPLPREAVVEPMVFPIIGAVRWRDDYGADRGSFLHTGIDIRAAKMTPIVAPISGVLGMKEDSFWIYGQDGYTVLGTHLNDDNLGRHDHRGGRDMMFAPGLHANQHVFRGQFLGYVGMSGDATGPHLHFELYAPGAGRTEGRLRSPFLSLKRSQHLSQPIAETEPQHVQIKNGEMWVQGYVRLVNRAEKAMTLILLYREVPGHLATLTFPTYLKVKLSLDQVQSCGGWESIEHTPALQPVTAVVSAATHDLLKVAQ